MTFNPGIPNATDLVSQSQSQLKTNFTQLNNLYALDHFAWNAGVSTGLHKWLQLQSPTSASPVAGTGGDPNAPTGSNAVLYTHVVSAATQLFFQNAAATFPVLLGSVSGSLTYNTVSGGQTEFGIQIGGMALKAGKKSGVSSGGTTISFLHAFANTCITALCVGNGAVYPFQNADATTTQISLGSFGGGAQTIYYIAIGT